MFATNARAQVGVVKTTLYSFQGGVDGASPQAGLVQGSDGFLYGTTQNGGTNGNGTIFRIGHGGGYVSLYSFTGSNDGAAPVASLVEGSGGYFLGTTRSGGAGGAGTVFKVDGSGSLTTLHSFNGASDGYGPYAPLVQGNDGYYYGTTLTGGTNGGGGTVFKISDAGDFTSLYSFSNSYPEEWPKAALVPGSNSGFYGCTSFGVLFTISTNGTYTRLAYDSNANGGDLSEISLAGGSDGFFYGTTGYGSIRGTGKVFKMSSSGALTPLAYFSVTNGILPAAALIRAKDEYLYGTTERGGVNGANGYGTIFRISTNGVLTSLYSFKGGNDGGDVVSSLVQGSDGSFYGTTAGGGQNGFGTVFRLTVLPDIQFAVSTNGVFSLMWSTYAGWTYQAQYSDDLNSSSWINLGGSMIATGAPLGVTDTNGMGRERFYRVLVAP